MVLEDATLSVDYLVKQSDSPADATIFQNQREAGRIHTEGKGIFKLLGNENQSWILCNRVNGEVRPFSMTVVSGFDKDLIYECAQQRICFEN